MEVQFGPLVTHASGKIGGMVYAGFRGKKIVMKKAQKHVPPSADQRLIQLYGRHANRLWRRLGESERVGGQGFLFDFYEPWAYHQRFSKTPQQAFFVGEYVKFARGDSPAYEFPLVYGTNRQYPPTSFGISFLPSNQFVIGLRTPEVFPGLAVTVRALLYWTDDYDPRAERQERKMGFRYFLTPEVEPNSNYSLQDTARPASGETSRDIIVGGAMYYFYGVRGTYATSLPLQLPATIPPDSVTGRLTRHKGGAILME